MYDKYFTDGFSKEYLAKFKELRTINELMQNSVSLYRDKPAIRTHEAEFTYGQLGEDVAKCRGFLESNGIRRGDNVALLLKNEYDFIRYFLATATMGATAVLVPMQTPAERIVPLCRNFDARLLIHSRVFGDAFKSQTTGFAVFSQDDIVLGEPADEYEDLTENTPAAIMFTGGTTGNPKGAILSHINMMRGTINGMYGLPDGFGRRYYALLPFTHVFGLIRNGLTALYSGSSIFMCEDMKGIFKDLPVAKPDIMVLVPGLAELVWSVIAGRGKEAVGGALEIIICGGAPVPQKLLERLRDVGISAYPGYGLTETANLVSGNVRPFEKPNCVGHPYSYQQVKLVDDELYVLGENVMLGYYKNDKANEEAFDEEGWFRTGDLARIDEDGDIYITGRIKNVIILDNGENVSPEEIEDALTELPFIQACLASEDKNAAGQKIIALEVFPAEKALEAMKCEDPQALIQDAVDKFNEKAPSFMRVSKVTLRDTDFERSGSMKIIRKKVIL